MVITTTINATVPAGTSGDIIFYEDINANQDGTQVDRNGRAYNNEQTIALEDGTNEYNLSNFAGSIDNEYWYDLDISNTDREAGLVVNSVEIDPDAATLAPGTGTLEWTTETEFNNVRDEVGIATDGLGTHPSAGSAFQGYPYGDLRKELLMYFPFDDNKSTSTAQNAAHGEPGKLDTVSYSSDSLVESRSLSFTSAGSNVSIERYPQIEIEDGVFTASVAFKVDAANVTGDVVLFGDKDLSSTNDTAGFVIYLAKPSSNVNVRAAVETTGGSQRTGATSGTNFGDNSWHVATLTKTDDGTFDMYVDGVRRFGMGSLGDITSTNEFRVGIAHNGSSNDYRGLIEEVRLYGKAFSQVEAEQLYLIRDSDYQTTSNLPSATPTSRYDFEGTGSTATDTQGSNDGTISGATRITDRVIGSKSISFDGSNDYVEITNSIDGLSEWSITSWVNVRDATPDGTIIGRWSTNDSLKTILLYWDTGANEFRFIVGDGASTASAETEPKSIENIWVHVAATYSSSQIRIYYNGALEAEVDNPPVPQSNTNLYIGDEDSGSTRPLNGHIDDLRIYDSELTPAQIERIYNFQQPRLPENSTPETGLNGWLPLNESAGDAIDLAAGNDGTVNGPTQGAIGIQGTTSYSFDGTNDSIELVNNYYSLPISVSAWAINNQADGTRRDIINFRDNLRFIISTGVNGTNTIDVWDGDWTEVGSYTANEWFHVVATIDSDGLTKIYADGNLSAVENLSPTNANPNRNVVGKDPNNIGYWDGRIGEIRTYRRRLRPSEIDLLYRRGNINIDQATTDSNLAKFDSALGRWSFDDSDTDGTTLVDTFGNNDATLNGSPTTGVDGVGEGKCYTFDGTDDDVTVSAPGWGFNETSNFSISCWIKLDSNSDGYIWDLRQGGAGQGFALFHDASVGDSLRFAIEDTSNNQRIADKDINVGDWYHVVCTHSSDRLMELYLNGTLADSNAAINSYTMDTDFVIGASNGLDSSWRWEGEIDEMRVYDERLNSYQIWQLYSLGRNQNWVTHNE